MSSADEDADLRRLAAVLRVVFTGDEEDVDWTVCSQSAGSSSDHEHGERDGLSRTRSAEGERARA